MAGVEPARTVGRHGELEAIGDLLASLAQGVAGAVVLRGEAGIGKSHLCHVAAARAADSGIQVAWATADELEQDRPGRMLVDLGSELGPDAPAPTGTDAVGAGADPGYRTVEHFLAGVDRAAASAPVLLVFEDLHWADALSLRGLASLLRSLGPASCAVLATMRPHPSPRGLVTMEAAVTRATGRILDLTGLDGEQALALASAEIGASPGTTIRTMVAGAAGNPFMVEELVRSARREASLHVVDGVADVDDGSIPATLREALLRQLGSLPDDTVDSLRHASLLGRRFTASEVATISESQVVEIVGALAGAVRAGTVIATGDHHEFRHDLVREAVYSSIPAAARWDLHRAAGAALAAAGAPALRVAMQFAAGARPGDLEAVEWLRRAGEDALSHDTGSAAVLFERALSLAPPESSGRFELEADLVEVLAWAGRIDDAIRRGQALVDRALSPAQRFRAHQALGTVRSTVGDLRAAAEHLRAAASSGAADDVTAGQLRCAAAGMSTIAGVEPPSAARAEAVPHLASERPALACWARNTLAVAAVCEGAYDEVVEHARVASSILDDNHVRPLGFLIPHTWWSTGLQYVDRFDEARDAAARARARAEARGDVGLLVQVMAGSCGITWATGEWDDTMAEIEASLALADETGAVVHTILLHSLWALIARERGDARDAAEHVERAEVIAASGTMHLFGVDVLALVRARMLLDGGAADEACDLVLAVWDLTSALRGLIQWRSLGPLLVELCVTTGRTDRAREVAGELAELAGRSSAPSGAATADWARALVDRDARLLATAADALLATPRWIDAAAASEDAVRVLLDDGGPVDEIGRLLDAAEEVHRRTGAGAAIERVRSMRRAAGLRAGEPVRAATFGWDSLTPKERHVVQLVSEGRSNPDIAAELFISRRTVEAHLSHVFRKLGVSNRTHLARQAIERQGHDPIA